MSANEEFKRLSGQALEWVLKILVTMGACNNFVSKYNFSDDELARSLFMDKWLGGGVYDRRQIIKEIHLAYEENRNKSRLCLSEDEQSINNNVDKLSEDLGFSVTDKKVFAFVINLYANDLLCEAFELLGEMTAQKAIKYVSRIVDCDPKAVSHSLSKQSKLGRAGLIEIRHRSEILSGKYRFDLLNSNLFDVMSGSEMDLEDIKNEITAGIISKPPKVTLRLEDYNHISDQVVVLYQYLKQSLTRERQGVNILIHGRPGTGKSELSRVMADNIGSDIFEVSFEDEWGEPISGQKRLQALNAAHHLLIGTKSIMVFDEAEDVFSGNFFQSSIAEKHKAWVNRILEEAPNPVIWISNSASIDNAFIRRFDMVIHLDVPPKSQRKKLLQTMCVGKIDAKPLEYLAESEALSPAVLQRAIDVAATLDQGGDINAQQLPGIVGNIVCSTLKTQGHKVPKAPQAGRIDFGYDPGLVNSNIDLSYLAEGIRQSGDARICLYGPPGTGKTEFGRWLADQLDKPMQIKKASNLLGMYVGETEQNIAQTFEKAERESAILQIDEVDSFLQDRRSADKSWETTLVNEMLTQMESYSGIFIASTNLMDNLDQAALRRFDLKIELGYLKKCGAEKMLIKLCEYLGVNQPDVENLNQLAKINNLTPGDFSVVARQARFNRPGNTSGLLRMILEESSVKESGKKKPIGFIN